MRNEPFPEQNDSRLDSTATSADKVNTDHLAVAPCWQRRYRGCLDARYTRKLDYQRSKTFINRGKSLLKLSSCYLSIVGACERTCAGAFARAQSGGGLVCMYIQTGRGWVAGK